MKKLPAGLVGLFCSNLADNIDKLLGSEFNGRIANDADIPSKDVQKNIFATSDFAKGMQTDINHYVTKDRINSASFRQKVWSNKQEYYKKAKSTWTFFEDISTCHAENPFVGSFTKRTWCLKKGYS